MALVPPGCSGEYTSSSMSSSVSALGSHMWRLAYHVQNGRSRPASSNSGTFGRLKKLKCQPVRMSSAASEGSCPPPGNPGPAGNPGRSVSWNTSCCTRGRWKAAPAEAMAAPNSAAGLARCGRRGDDRIARDGQRRALDPHDHRASWSVGDGRRVDEAEADVLAAGERSHAAWPRAQLPDTVA